MVEILIVYTTGMKHWYYAELHDEIVYAFDQCSVPLCARFETVVKDDEYGEGAAIMKLEALERKGLIDACDVLVIVPTESSQLTEWVAVRQEAAAKRGKPLHVVALTVPFHGRGFARHGLPEPSLVISHNKDGACQLGRHAATASLRGLPASGDINVLLLPSQQSRIDSQDRLEGFLEGLNEGLPGRRLQPHRLEDCQWSREYASERVKAYLRSNDAKRIDVLFAANDETALGARDALQELHDRMIDLVGGTGVYGYDAIEEACKLIKSKDRFFRATVCQNLDDMAQRLAEIVSKLLNGAADTISPIDGLVAPTLVVPLRAIAAARDAYAIPPLVDENGAVNTHIWVDIHGTAEIEDVKPDTLRRERTRSRALVREATWGKDAVGRIWKSKAPNGKVWYLKRSLKWRRDRSLREFPD